MTRIRPTNRPGRRFGVLVSVALVLAITGVVVIVALAVIGMVLYVFVRVKPELLKFDAGLTRRLWLRLEMRSPQRDDAVEKSPRAD